MQEIARVRRKSKYLAKRYHFQTDANSTGVGKTATVEVDIDRHGADEDDHVWISLILPIDSLTTIVRRALERKLKKLIAEPAARHVLLLEKADFVHAHSKIRVAIDQMSGDFPELARVDEIWLVITGSLGKREYVVLRRNLSEPHG